MRKRLSLVIRLAPVLLLTGADYPLSMDTFLSIDHGTDYARVKANPTAYRGTTLLLGGKIVAVTAAGTGKELTVSCYRLGPRDWPLEPAPLCGRFVVTVGGNDDAELLTPGRLVTLAGIVAGAVLRDGKTVPRLSAVEVHPWLTAEEERRRRYESYPPYWYDPWCDPFFHPRYRARPYRYPSPWYCW